MMADIITKNLWHVFGEDGKRLGLIKRINGERSTIFESWLESQCEEAMFQTFDQAFESFRKYDTSRPQSRTAALDIQN